MRVCRRVPHRHAPREGTPHHYRTINKGNKQGGPDLWLVPRKTRIHSVMEADMTPRLRWLAVTAVVLLGGYGAILAVNPAARPRWTSPVRKRADSGADSGHRERKRKPPPPEFEEIPAEIVIPPTEEVGPLRGCPMKQLETILGVSISHPHGICIGAVVADGPAAKAGIQPGDQLARPSDCPSSTLGRFLPRADSRTISVTIRRPKSDQPEGQADREPPSDAEDEASEASPDEKPSP